MKNLKIRTLYLEITHACNQHCKHCYLDGGIHHTFEELTTEDIKTTLFEFKKQGGKYVIITGGEAAVRKDCFEILDYLDTLNIPFTFASNSLIIDDKKLEKLSKYNNLDTYFTSLLGSTPEEHNYLCGNNSYDKVFKALDYFESCGIKTYVQVTLANNYMDKMQIIADKLCKYKKCTVKFTPIAGFGVKTTYDESLLVPSKRFDLFYNIVKDLKKRYPTQIEDSNIHNYDQISTLINDYKENSLYSLKYGFLAVRPNGDKSFSCNMGNPYVFGNVKDGIEIPINDKLIEYINVIREADQLVLKEAKEHIIELDTAIDNKIKIIYQEIHPII